MVLPAISPDAIQSPEHGNGRARHGLEEMVALHAAGDPGAVDRRLEQLDREWGLERTLQAGGAVAVLAGVALGAAVDRRLLALPAVAGGLLLLQAVGGWSPQVGLLRRLGWRTASEIDEERYALKALRGDFRGLRALTSAADRADVARFEGEGGRVTEPGEGDAHDQRDQAAVTAAFQAAGR
jgi:hypothetical protein